MRIHHLAIFLADLQGGGAERMMLNLAAGLADEGIEVDLVLARSTGPYLDQVPPSVRLVDLRAGGVLGALPGLARYLRTRRPQLLLSTLQHSSVAALLANAASRTSTPVFVREANTPSEERTSPRHPKRWLTQLVLRRLYSRAHSVVAVSTGVAEDIHRYYRLAGSRVEIIHNPVVTPEIGQLAELADVHPWLETGGPPVVLGVGRLQPQKDFTTLIQAFSRLRENRPAKLIILGEGDERRKLEDLAAELGLAADVSMPGFVDNPFAFMSRAAVFVLSSRWEGLPGALIQAMACGCPIVATNCRSGPAEVLENGRYGKLVPVGDVDAMAAAIHCAIESDRRSAELRRRSEDFSVRSVVRHYIRYFEDSLANKAGDAGAKY